MWTNFFPIIIPLILVPILLTALWRIRLKKLKSYNSPLLGKIEVFEKYNKEKMVTINSYPQGVSIEQRSIRDSYWFSVAEQVIKACKNKKSPQVLMLGLGANTIPNLIASKNSNIRLTILEIDKFMIQVCRDFFGLDQLPNYKLICVNAFKFFDKPRRFKTQFDVIIVDIFTGRPPYVSIKSNQPHFIEKLFPYLKEDGLIVFNRPAHNPQTKADGEALKNYLSNFFQKTEIFFIKDPRRFSNHVIAASQKVKLT